MTRAIAILLTWGLLGASQAAAQAYRHARPDGPAMPLPSWPPKAGVLLYLSFDEGQGQRARAVGLWGNALLGATDQPEPSDPAWTRGLRGGGLRFDGRDDFLTVPGVDRVRLEAFTIEAWGRPEGTSREMVLDYGGTTWGFALSKAWHGVYLAVGHAGRGTRVDTPQHTVAIGRWNHLAATFERGQARVYVNGRLEAQHVVPEAMGQGGAGVPLLIGKLRPNHYHLTGVLDELLVLSTARSADEIFADMLATLPAER
jgi:hypothetical protein